YRGRKLAAILERNGRPALTTGPAATNPARDQRQSATLTFKEVWPRIHQKSCAATAPGGGNRVMRKLLLILTAAAAACFSAALYADNYPSRPVTLVAVFGPGSASDTICRIIANQLGPALGQPGIVRAQTARLLRFTFTTSRPMATRY